LSKRKIKKKSNIKIGGTNDVEKNAGERIIYENKVYKCQDKNKKMKTKIIYKK
tara:strand:+ start:383 stop:541 length:159 start_codon:yes stop_codon:yes gene_type:complete